ncbi:MAG: Uncharacterized protein Athens071425_522 [Parcubacteria group bacterium Athens0714_25]|nr:MAG: Uncharacterized protein Athens071425_522 [Parcubacteria group bacterium Athens0714_25]
MKILSDKNLTILLSKLSGDFLVLFMFAYGAILLAEAILPGIVSNRLSMLTLTWILSGALVLSAYLAKKSKIDMPAEKNITAKKSAPFWMLLVFAATIIILSLFGFSVWEITLITAISLAIIFYAKKEFARDI